jgi:hypothetical protein
MEHSWQGFQKLNERAFAADVRQLLADQVNAIVGNVTISIVGPIVGLITRT